MYTDKSAARFWAKVDRSAGPTGCWPWLAAQDGRGYGHLTLAQQSKKAYRVAYELVTGPIPPGSDIDHMCHNKICVNPMHLRVTTHKQNSENLPGASRNSKTGIRGVSWHTTGRKWRVTVMHNYRQHHGGMFTDIHEAEQAAIALRRHLFTHSDRDNAA